MQKVSLSLDEDHVEMMDELVDQGEADSRSEAARVLLDRATDVEELRADLDRARARADDLQRQLAAANARKDDVDELVERVEDEVELHEDERRRAREREAAGVVTRAKWWVFGRDLDDVDGEE